MQRADLNKSEGHSFTGLGVSQFGKVLVILTSLIPQPLLPGREKGSQNVQSPSPRKSACDPDLPHPPTPSPRAGEVTIQGGTKLVGFQPHDRRSGPSQRGSVYWGTLDFG